MLKPSVTWKRQTQFKTLKSGFEYEGPIGSVSLIDGLINDTIPDGALAGAHRAAAEGERAMQAHASWTDRTGEARKGLFGEAGQDGDSFFIRLSHGPDIEYGIWLENRWNGRYAIVIPTTEIMTQRLPELMAGELSLALSGRGSKFRHRGSGQFA